MVNPGRHGGIANGVVEPVWHNVEYSYADTANFRGWLAGDATLGRYGRYHNPSWRRVEQRIAELEDYADAVLFPSGMAALTAVLLTFARAGDTVAYCRHSYRQLHAVIHEVAEPHGLTAVALDQRDPDEFAERLGKLAGEESFRLCLLEIPSNPHLYMVDVENARRTLGPDRLLAVDSTFASPLFFDPRRFGADMVIHSCTKYIGGHGDVMAGAVAGSAEIIDRLRRFRDITGFIPDPGAAFLLNRSLDTLRIRMRHYGETAGEIARFLEAQPWVRQVFYTGLPSHPHADLVSRFLHGHAGVLAFELEADEAATAAFVDALEIPYMTSGFGSTRSLIEQLSVFTFYRVSAAERESLGITDSLIRLSVGMESADELIADMKEAAARTLDKSRSAVFVQEEWKS